MSPAIWTLCEGKSKLFSLSVSATRIVEDQSKNSTRKLVDSDQEQERLERLIEGIKPSLPSDPAFSNLHYLLSTPFRYPPLRWGSRFRKRTENGVWYGAESIATALAEKAYYRIRFLQDTTADLSSEIILTAFHVRIKSAKAIDLTESPFAAYEDRISSPTTYASSQPLGTDMRNDHVVFSLYRSARDPLRGKNVAIFSPLAFMDKQVTDASRESWYCFATREIAEFRSLSFTQTQRARFRRQDFEIDGRFPIPDLQ